VCLNIFNDFMFGLFIGIVRIQGSTERNQHSVIEDLPAASLLQTPGARADATTWCDESGHVWLFAGEGYDDDASDVQPKLLNDLWMFSTTQLEWNIMHTGRLQTTYSTNNGEHTETVSIERRWNDTSVVPEPRKRAASCGVSGVVFVVFGGFDSNGSSLSDTWIYIVPKAQWLLLSELVRPPTIWYTEISWCHLDSFYVIGSSTDNATEMWRLNLRTLKWTNESVYLTDQQQCTDYSLLAAQPVSANSINVVWNGTFYLYQWQIMHDDNHSNSLIFSTDLQRWQFSLPYTKFMNNWHNTPMLWSDLNSFNGASVSCSSSDILRKPNDCRDGNGELCSLHGNFQIQSSTPWPEQRLHTSSWFYEGSLYIFGGQAVDSDQSKTFFNDLCILQQSDSTDSNYTVPVLGFVIVLVAVILSGFCVFFILRYRDYRRGRNKSHELKIRYIPLRDLDLYE